MSRASAELLTRLTERRDEATSLRDRLATSEASWLGAEQRALDLSSTVDDLRLDLTATSNSLDASRTALADYRRATDEARELDARAIATARRERDDALVRELWVALGGMAVGILFGLVIP